MNPPKLFEPRFKDHCVVQPLGVRPVFGRHNKRLKFFVGRLETGKAKRLDLDPSNRAVQPISLADLVGPRFNGDKSNRYSSGDTTKEKSNHLLYFGFVKSHCTLDDELLVGHIAFQKSFVI